MIHVIGDSHTWVFTGEPGFSVFYVGSTTAFGYNNPNSKTQSEKKVLDYVQKYLKQEDSVLMVAGEIDCRIHVYNLSKKTGKTIQQLIDSSIEAYGSFLKRLRDIIPVKVCGIPSPGRQGNIYNYPYYASYGEAANIYREFNNKLKDFCLSNNFYYFDLYSKTVGPDGRAKPEFLRDEVHLNKKVFSIVSLQDLI